MELCGSCGHQLDHLGKQCQHEAPVTSGDARCACPSGVRTDVLLCRQNAEIIKRQGLTLRMLQKLLLVQTEVMGLEVIDEEDGSITLQPKQQQIITPH